MAWKVRVGVQVLLAMAYPCLPPPYKYLYSIPSNGPSVTVMTRTNNIPVNRRIHIDVERSVRADVDYTCKYT